MDVTMQPAQSGSAPATAAGQRRMMVLRAFLAQNVSVGCAFGGFGVSVLPLQQQYGASRGAVTLALALCVLMLGLIGPLIATLIGRIGLRWTMMIGTVISAAGYALLAVAPSMPVVLLLYAFPIGIGLAMFGPFPASVLASNWYPHNPGPALGIANTPLFVAILPIVGLVLIRDHGLATFYLTLAALHLVLLPLLLGVSDAPADKSGPARDAHGHVDRAMISARSVLKSPVFWAMCLGAGFLNAVGITGVSHLAAFAAERGIAATQAAALLSILGGASVVGSLIVGVLCGRIGAAPTLALIAASLGLSWLVLGGTTAFAVMATMALLLGSASAGVFPAINMLSGRLFGIEALPRVIGLFGLVTLPLTFCLPPLAGVLRDTVEGYGPVIAVIVAGSAAAAVIFLAVARTSTRREPVLAA